MSLEITDKPVVQWETEQVPPPQTAPVQAEAERLGLLPGLRIEPSSRQWRCSECKGMQPLGSGQVWVPDSVRSFDPEWSVTENCRLNAWNGEFSAWCLGCARKLGRNRVAAAARHDVLIVAFVLIVLLGFSFIAHMAGGRP